MSTWSQRILKHDHDRNFWSILILGNSVIRTDLPICSAEHQEFVSFSGTTNLIPICYAGKWRRGRKFFDVSSLLVTNYRPDPAVGKKSTRTKKEKPPLVQFRRGKALLRFQITGSQYSQKCSCSLPCNTFFWYNTFCICEQHWKVFLWKASSLQAGVYLAKIHKNPHPRTKAGG